MVRASPPLLASGGCRRHLDSIDQVELRDVQGLRIGVVVGHKDGVV